MSTTYKRYALVTGASSGIGRAIAIELASRKINLVLVALPDTGLNTVATSIADAYQVDVKYYETNLIKENAVRELYEWCCGQHLQINILVNNAGLGTKGFFKSSGLSEVELMMKLNNQSLVLLSHYFLPLIISTGHGYILNVGSLASFMNIPGKAVYSATKSFVYSFSSALRIELRPYKISVSCLCPGGTITSERVLENIAHVRFAGRMMLQQPAEVAQEAVIQMFRRKKLIIPGTHNKLLFYLWLLLPQRVVDYILLNVFNKEKAERIVRPSHMAIGLRAFISH